MQSAQVVLLPISYLRGAVLRALQRILSREKGYCATIWPKDILREMGFSVFRTDIRLVVCAILDELVLKGFLRVQGTGRGRRYIITRDSPLWPKEGGEE